MKDTDKKTSKKETKLEEAVAELTTDLQRVQADFVNYRRRVDEERKSLSEGAKAATIIKLLPVIDDIERAIAYVPTELAEHKWAQGVVSLGKRLDKAVQELGLTRIEASPGTLFDPSLHEAVMMEESEGDEEVVSEELRAGYQIGDFVVRHSMVKVKRQPSPPGHNSHTVMEEQVSDEQPEQVKAED